MIDPKIFPKLELLADALKRHKAGKKLTRDQEWLLAKLDENNDKPRSDRWTVTEAANMMGVDVKTVTKGLRDLGFDVSRGGTYLVKDHIRAVYGDEQAEKVRGMKLDNEERERNAQEESGELVRMHEVEQLLAARVIAPLRQELMNMPAVLANLCNPGDPAKADAVLTGWRDEFFGLMVEKLK